MAAAPCPCCWQSEPASAGIAARAHSRSRVSSPVSRRGSAAHVAWWIISLQLCSSGRSSAEPVWSAPWWAKWRANPKTCVWLPAALKKEKSVFAALIRDLAFSFWGSVCSQTASTRWTRCRLNVLWGLNKEITSCSFSCARWDPQTSVLGWNKASFRCCFFRTSARPKLHSVYCMIARPLASRDPSWNTALRILPFDRVAFSANGQGDLLLPGSSSSSIFEDWLPKAAGCQFCWPSCFLTHRC